MLNRRRGNDTGEKEEEEDEGRSKRKRKQQEWKERMAKVKG